MNRVIGGILGLLIVYGINDYREKNRKIRELELKNQRLEITNEFLKMWIEAQPDSKEEA